MAPHRDGREPLGHIERNISAGSVALRKAAARHRSAARYATCGGGPVTGGAHMRFLVRRSSTLLSSLLAIATWVGAQTPAAPPPDVVSSSAGSIRIERLATLEYPWGM